MQPTYSLKLAPPRLDRRLARINFRWDEPTGNAASTRGCEWISLCTEILCTDTNPSLGRGFFPRILGQSRFSINHNEVHVSIPCRAQAQQPIINRTVPQQLESHQGLCNPGVQWIRGPNAPVSSPTI